VSLLLDTQAHALVAVRLAPHHRDPFDRMLVAQAVVEDMTLVTRDADIRRYGVTTLRV
jgi:PIN domain nuclease of toxin-antitoxin system